MRKLTGVGADVNVFLGTFSKINKELAKMQQNIGFQCYGEINNQCRSIYIASSIQSKIEIENFLYGKSIQMNRKYERITSNI